MSFMESFWDVIVWFFWIFVFVAYLIALFSVISDLFRDHSLSGWAKAIWIIFLIFVPILTTLVYLIARGSGMNDRTRQEIQAEQKATDDYIRQVSGTSPAEQIDKAHKLLASGAITSEEFETIKRQALATN